MLSARTIHFKRSHFSSHTSFNTSCVSFLFAFFLAVFISSNQLKLQAEGKFVDLLR